MTMTELGRVLRLARKEKAFTQQELAELSGIHPITLSNIERGEASDIGFRKLERLLEQLGLQFAVRPVQVGRTLDELENERLRERAAHTRLKPISPRVRKVKRRHIGDIRLLDPSIAFPKSKKE